MKKIDEKQKMWDPRYMSVAKLVATWSTCIRENRQVGAVIVKDNRIVATGYNGAPSGIKSCQDRGECMRDKLNIESGTRQEMCFSIHAEQAAIIQAAKMGISINGASIYITHQPCSLCARMIIHSGIKRIVYEQDYPDKFSIKLLKEAGMELVKIKQK